MKTRAAFVFVLMVMGAALAGYAQFDPENVCRMDDGRLIFTLDQRWTTSQKKEIAQAYDLDSVLMAWAMEGRPVITQNGIRWTTRKLDAHRIELSKEQGKSSGKDASNDKIILVDDQWIKLSSAVERESVPYGVNRLTRNTVVNLSDGKVRFFLPGYRDARRVFVSGSFNDWSTLQTPLHACDSGWTVTLGLDPGKYSYKFIIDGKWTNDPYNKLREDDTYDGYNNIFFCYNYKFVLNGFQNARKVLLAASFNNWNKTQLRMVRIRGSWMLPLYLREGTHAYKFLVDDQWMTDPANKIKRPDGMGHENSFMGLGDTLYFHLDGFTSAKKVAVAGNFNAWNTGELFMDRTRNGWQLPYVLAPGNYEYKFLVDGKWMPDPGNPCSTGSGDIINSCLVVKPNYTFRLEQFSGTTTVMLTGSFNGWSPDGYRMIKKAGAWIFPIYLKPGKYTYKFIVDQKWILDPANDLWEDNEYGTGNSVLWIEP